MCAQYLSLFPQISGTLTLHHRSFSFAAGRDHSRKTQSNVENDWLGGAQLQWTHPQHNADTQENTEKRGRGQEFLLQDCVFYVWQEAVLRKYGRLNKTCIMTPVSTPTWMAEGSQGPTARWRAIGNLWLLTESQSFPGICLLIGDPSPSGSYTCEQH